MSRFLLGGKYDGHMTLQKSFPSQLLSFPEISKHLSWEVKIQTLVFSTKTPWGRSVSCFPFQVGDFKSFQDDGWWYPGPQSWLGHVNCYPQKFSTPRRLGLVSEFPETCSKTKWEKKKRFLLNVRLWSNSREDRIWISSQHFEASLWNPQGL